jgi:hypothetical protein
VCALAACCRVLTWRLNLRSIEVESLSAIIESTLILASGDSVFGGHSNIRTRSRGCVYVHLQSCSDGRLLRKKLMS